MSKTVFMAGIIAASAMALTSAAPAVASGDPAFASATGHKVGICHATGSKTNPYVYIVVDQHAADAHRKHQDGRDIIGVSSADKCKCPQGTHSPVPTPAPTGKGSHDDKGEVKGTSTTPQPAPTTLPDTGASAGLSALLGLPTLALAGRAYLRSRAS
jgi:hypothetical protein